MLGAQSTRHSRNSLGTKFFYRVCGVIDGLVRLEEAFGSRWSVMCSSDPWSSGGRRRPTGERGIVHRLPEGLLPGAPRGQLQALGVTESWFYKWRDRPPTERQRRRAALDQKVAEIFEDSGGTPRTYGSPRVYAELRGSQLVSHPLCEL